MNDSPERDMAVFTEALQLPASERAAFVERVCGLDHDMRGRVEALLRACDRLGNFLNEPAAELPLEEVQELSIGEGPGDRIGRYKLVEQIGEGGYGVVFMAEQEEPVRRKVALKIIKPGMDTKSVIARFEAERQALALMDHPNIAKVFDAGATTSGRPYFVMELVRGLRVTEYCDQNALTTDERLKIFAQICHAVQHAHQKGIIHRDIKPSNILVTQNIEGAPEPVVIDFGIAKATTNQHLTDRTLLTASEMLIGTPAYMSPEQASFTRDGLDTRTDIYSLGVLLYELLTGSTPFNATELLKAGLDEIRRVIREQEPARPSTRLTGMKAADLTTIAKYRRSEPVRLIRAVRGDLDWIVMKAMEKDRTRRYETANGLALDVKRFLANETVSARPPSKLYKLQKTAQRNKLLFAGLGLIAVMLAGVLVTLSTFLARERQANRKAATALQESKDVTQLLEDMLEGAGPLAANGRDTSILREILNLSALRVGTLTNEPAVRAELSSLMAHLYLDIGDYGKAENMGRAALVIQEKLHGPHSGQAAACLHDLGRTFWKEGKLEPAEQAHSQALQIRRQIFGTNSAEAASSLNALGGVYTDQNKLTEAEGVIREALEIRRRLFPGDNLEVADSLEGMCRLLDAQRRWHEAAETARVQIEMCRHFPERDDLLAEALDNLALAAGFDGQTEVQEAAHKEAFALKAKILPAEHPYLVKSIYNLGEILRLRGNSMEAHGVLLAAASIQEKLLGPDYPDTLATLGSLGEVLASEGKWDEAENVHREALARSRKRSGDQDGRTLWECEHLAHALMAQKKYREAEELVDGMLRPGLTNTPASSGLWSVHVELLGRQGRWQEAAADSAIAARLEPNEQYHLHRLAVLLVASGDRAGYAQYCRSAPWQFGSTANPYVAGRMAEDCLLMPDSGADTGLADELATRAVKFGRNDPAIGYFQACKALSEYRRKRFAEAVSWSEQSLECDDDLVRAKACAVLAMAQWNLGQKDAARDALRRGNELAPAHSTKAGASDFGDSWVAWLFARITLEEAAGLIQP